ncbi:hypothetical protein JKP88DRAFT_244667 [Tribonema minus]|uniref:Uncharacterized protein n=1 Tax=Tribonema minus TaxID=303371 RepID=A0A835Z439_9STRA|nr:hypothetical protein JKP88DRAFT_244667 [Tribonema minus]
MTTNGAIAGGARTDEGLRPDVLVLALSWLTVREAIRSELSSKHFRAACSGDGLVHELYKHHPQRLKFMTQFRLKAVSVGVLVHRLSLTGGVPAVRVRPKHSPGSATRLMAHQPPATPQPAKLSLWSECDHSFATPQPVRDAAGDTWRQLIGRAAQHPFGVPSNLYPDNIRFIACGGGGIGGGGSGGARHDMTLLYSPRGMEGAWVNSVHIALVSDTESAFDAAIRINSVWWVDLALAMVPPPPPGRYRIYWRMRERSYRGCYFSRIRCWVKIGNTIIQEPGQSPPQLTSPGTPPAAFPRVFDRFICDIDVRAGTEAVTVGFWDNLGTQNFAATVQVRGVHQGVAQQQRSGLRQQRSGRSTAASPLSYLRSQEEPRGVFRSHSAQRLEHRNEETAGESLLASTARNGGDNGERELAALQLAEEEQRLLQAAEAQEKARITAQLRSLKKAALGEVAKSAMSELAALQQQRSALAAREKEKLLDIEQMRAKILEQDRQAQAARKAKQLGLGVRGNERTGGAARGLPKEHVEAMVQLAEQHGKRVRHLNFKYVKSKFSPHPHPLTVNSNLHPNSKHMLQEVTAGTKSSKRPPSEASGTAKQAPTTNPETGEKEALMMLVAALQQQNQALLKVSTMPTYPPPPPFHPHTTPFSPYGGAGSMGSPNPSALGLGLGGGGMGGYGMGAGGAGPAAEAQLQQVLSAVEAENARLQAELQQLMGPTPLDQQTIPDLGPASVMSPRPPAGAAFPPLVDEDLLPLQKEQKEELQRLKFELQKLELESRLDEAKDVFRRQRKERELELESRLDEAKDAFRRQREEREAQQAHADALAKQKRDMEELQAAQALEKERQVLELQSLARSKPTTTGDAPAALRRASLNPAQPPPSGDRDMDQSKQLQPSGYSGYTGPGYDATPVKRANIDLGALKAGVVPGPYDKAEGLRVYLDYVTDVPRSIRTHHLTYCSTHSMTHFMQAGVVPGPYDKAEGLRVYLDYAGVVPGPYDKAEGLRVYLDYVTDVPRSIRATGRAISKVRVAYGAASRRKGGVFVFQLGIWEEYGAFETNPQARMVMEVQAKGGEGGEEQKGSGGKDKKRAATSSIGWASVNLFRPSQPDVHKLTLRTETTLTSTLCVYAGLWRVPLKLSQTGAASVDIRLPCAYDHTPAAAAAASAVIGGGSATAWRAAHVTALHVRVLHARDGAAADAFVIDPRTAPLYATYVPLMAGVTTRPHRGVAMLAIAARCVAVIAKMRYRANRKAGPRPAKVQLSPRFPLKRQPTGNNLNNNLNSNLNSTIRPLDAFGTRLSSGGGGSSAQHMRPGSNGSARAAAAAAGRAGSRGSVVSSVQEAGADELSDSDPSDAGSYTGSYASTRTSVNRATDLSNRGGVPGGRRGSMGQGVPRASTESQSPSQNSSPSAAALTAARNPMARRASMNALKRGSISRRPFEVGDGFDVYIDQAVGLPETCTVTKATLKALARGQALDPPGETLAVCIPSSLTTAPEFKLREEYRSTQGFDRATALLIRIDTLEAQTQQLCTVGFAVVTVFMEATGQPIDPQSASANAAAAPFLKEGNWQVPLYQKAPADLARLSEETARNLPRVPCASLLVRVKRAPRAISTDPAKPNGAVLSTASVPEQEWGRLGVVVPAPLFAPGAYDNHLLQLEAYEMAVLERRAAAEAQSPTRTSTKGRLTCQVHQSLGDATQQAPPYSERMLDYRWATQYWPDAGVSVCVAALINMRAPNQPFGGKALAHKAIFSLLSPGSFYRTPLRAEKVAFTNTYHPQSTTLNPRFDDPPSVFTSTTLTPHFDDPPTVFTQCDANGRQTQCLIVDVRCLHTDGKVADWYALHHAVAAALSNPPPPPPRPHPLRKLQNKPIMPQEQQRQTQSAAAAGDIDIGTHQVPLIGGLFPVELLSADDPVAAVLDGLHAKTYKFLDHSSALVQLNNVLLPPLPPALHDHNVSTQLLSQMVTAVHGDASKWAFDRNDLDSGRAISKLAPKQGGLRELDAVLNAALAAATGVPYRP